MPEEGNIFDTPRSLNGGVTEFALILLLIQRVNKSRDELLGQGVVTLSGKPAHWEDGRMQAPFIPKGRE